VADLYCELGQPADAEKLLQQELNPMRENRTQNSPTGRRLQVSLAETYLQRSMYAEAASLLTDLQRELPSSGFPDYKAHVNSFHTWVSLARISHRKSEWVEAISCWRHALRVLDRIKLNAGFNAGLVRCSIAHALMMTGEVGSKDLLQEGRANIASEPRVFWIPLFNSQWHDLIFDLLKKAGVD
jgi:tetratricopeptide (TPR) repeat protein